MRDLTDEEISRPILKKKMYMILKMSTIIQYRNIFKYARFIARAQ